MANIDYFIEIENNLSRCDPNHTHCEGITCDPSQGKIPRCHFFEERKSGEQGVVAIGENPGKMKGLEQEAIEISFESDRDRVNAYYAWKRIFERDYKQYQYYFPINFLLNELEIYGDILWTDLFKCEKTKSGSTLPEKTIRTCVKKYLANEIDVFKSQQKIKDFPILLFGKIAYENFTSDPIMNSLKDKNAIIGLPHPSRDHLREFIARPGNLNNLQGAIEAKRKTRFNVKGEEV